MIDFKKLQIEQRDWSLRNCPFTLPYQPLLGVIEEVGELAHAHLKAEQGIRNTTQEDKVDAVGDIVIYLLHYCNLNGIDFENAVATTWIEASKRDWVKYPGTGRPPEKESC